MNEISFSLLSGVHILSTYPAKMHLAANGIIFHVTRGYNGTVRILVNRIYVHFWLSSGALCKLSTFETVSPFLLTFLLTIITFQQSQVFTKGVIKKGKDFLQRRDITFWIRLYTPPITRCITVLDYVWKQDSIREFQTLFVKNWTRWKGWVFRNAFILNHTICLLLSF